MEPPDARGPTKLESPRAPRWRGWFIGAVVGLAIAGALGWRIREEWWFDAGLRQARIDVAAGRYAAAHARLTRQCARRPERAEAAYLLGVCEEALGNPDRAVELWSKIPPDSPAGTKAALGRGRLLLRAFGRLAEAEPLLERALRGPREVARSAVWELFSLLVWEGRLDEARALLERGWPRAPASERIVYLREHWRLDTVVVSEEEVHPVLEAGARHARDDLGYQLVQAALAAQYGRWEEAERRLDACRAAWPAHPALWRVRLAWAVAADRPVDAADALRHLPIDRLPPRTRLGLRAWFARQRGDPAREHVLLDALTRHSPGDSRALERLAALALQMGDAAQSNVLRDRLAAVDRAKERYRWGMLGLGNSPDRARAAELATLAESLGRDFEATGLRTIAAGSAADARATRSPPPEAASDALLADLDEATPSRAARDAESGPALSFRRDLLGEVVYETDPGPRHHLPAVLGGGCALVDYDRDGWLDLFVVQGGAFPPPDQPFTSRDRLLRNRGDGSFEDVSESARIASLPGGFGLGVTAGDYDNDGWPDLFLSRWNAYALWRNQGDGTFEDVTARARLAGARGFPTSAAFADLDNDGDLDLYVCHYLAWDPVNPPRCRSKHVPGRTVSCSPRQFRAEADRLYRNDAGRFVDVSAEAGIADVDADGRGLGVVAADLDGDGLVDLYVANDQSPNYFFRNRGGLRFEEIGLARGAACGADGVARAGMGVACGDLDRDGLPDLAVTNFFTESTTVYRNLGGGVFTDATSATGLAAASRFVLGFGIAFFDADNDGQLDLATANGHISDDRPAVPYAMAPQLFRGRAGHLRDVSALAGPPWNEALVARGLAVGDLDNDGRADVVLVPQNHPVVVARNVTAGIGHSLALVLEGTASNRDAVGARATVVAGGLRQTAWRLGGGSYLSASDSRLHFGLGSSAAADDVEIGWPSGRVQKLGKLPAGCVYLVRESAPRATPLRPLASQPALGGVSGAANAGEPPKLHR